ncbi:hypothetical protein [Leptospira vanthielii]|uniref:Uncharacterized protein n=1 Tax=Leptospira vanthielii TaxID=293085 RepID=A0ABY2NKR4_9LEPT|nr:hypothetical protein [Leptospira vanthielii]TGM48836.1 hypothetical protein EHQ95_15205 [Leptospira vanthielii]
MKKIILLTLTFITINCSARQFKFQDPASQIDSGKQGIVVFSAYIIYPNNRNPEDYTPATNDEYSILSIRTNGNDLKNLNTGEILKPSLHKVISEDKEKKMITVSGQDNTRYVIMGNSDDSAKNEIIHANGTFNEILFLDLDTKLGFNRVLHSITNPINGKIDYFFYPVDPEQSFQTLTLKPIPNKITYLGLFQIRIVNTTKENKFAKNKSNDFNSFITSREDSDEYIIASVKPDNGYFEKMTGIKYDKKKAEIRYLKDFIKTQESGHWKTIAEKQLKSLEN